MPNQPEPDYDAFHAAKYRCIKYLAARRRARLGSLDMEVNVGAPVCRLATSGPGIFADPHVQATKPAESNFPRREGADVFDKSFPGASVPSLYREAG